MLSHVNIIRLHYHVNIICLHILLRHWGVVLCSSWMGRMMGVVGCVQLMVSGCVQLMGVVGCVRVVVASDDSS